MIRLIRIMIVKRNSLATTINEIQYDMHIHTTIYFSSNEHTHIEGTFYE